MSELSLEPEDSLTDSQEASTADLNTSSSASFLSRCWMMVKKYGLSVMTIILLFGLVFYVKYEVTIIKQLSRISIERQDECLTALNDLSGKIDKLSQDHDQMLTLKTELNQVEKTMLTEQSLSGLAKSAELKNITLKLQQLERQNSFPTTHRVIRGFSHPSVQAVHLPFQVLSIDSMAGQDYASVQYHQASVPVRLNESLAGWKAVGLDSLAGVVVWENAQHRRITISMTERHDV
jgi:hypothetical protein